MLLIGAGMLNYSISHPFTSRRLILPLISHSITVLVLRIAIRIARISPLSVIYLQTSCPTVQLQGCNRVYQQNISSYQINILFLKLRTSTLFVYKQSHMVYICMKLHNILSPVWKLQIMDVPHNTNQPTNTVSLTWHTQQLA